MVAFVALGVDMLIYGIAVPVLPQFPAVRDGGDAATGLLFAVYAAALIAVTPLAGRWVDRQGPRAALLAGMLVLAGATVLFGLLDSLPALLLARTAQGAAAACSWVAGLALVAAVTPLPDRARNLALVLSAVSVGVLAGPPLGGLLADHLGRHAPFLLAAGIAVADGLLRLALIGPVRTADDDPGTIVGVWRVPGAAAVCGVVALGAGLLAFAEPVLPRHLAAAGYSSTTTGLVFGVAVLASALITPLAGWSTTRHPIRTTVGVGIVVSAVGLAGIGLSSAKLALVIPSMAAVGIGGGIILGSITGVIGSLGSAADPPALGAAFALFNLAYAAGLFVGPSLSGPITGMITFGPAMLLGGGLVLGVGALAWRQLRRAPVAAPGNPATPDAHR